MGSIRCPFKKIIFAGISFLFFLILLALAIFSLIYSPEYVSRVVRWGDSDMFDYRKFPERKISASPHPFHFLQKPDEKRVCS
jgi:hypothetical protein